MLRAGYVERAEDESGVSGTGRVAEWVEYTDGVVVVRWLSNLASTNVHPNMKAAEMVHGHQGKTNFVEVLREEIAVEVEEETPSTEDVEIG
jgi:hypothetical protein